MADFTPTQGRYLAFIHAYTALHGYPPSEAEIGAAMCVSPPSINQMVKTLEKRGLILRHPGRPRSLEVLVPEEEIPAWNNRKTSSGASGTRTGPRRAFVRPAAPPANLYVLGIFLADGPVGKKFANKVVHRVIEIRGDQTLEQLHQAIFEAYDRWDEHLYEFQFGKRPFDPSGPNFGVGDQPKSKRHRDARTITMDELELQVERVFGYWFDFGDNWYHQIPVDRIEQAIATVTYPRVIKRVGKSPPQYDEDQSRPPRRRRRQGNARRWLRLSLRRIESSAPSRSEPILSQSSSRRPGTRWKSPVLCSIQQMAHSLTGCVRRSSLRSLWIASMIASISG